MLTTRSPSLLELQARPSRTVHVRPLMEHLNDWDLQAVVRSCSFSGPASHEAEATPPPAACPEVIRGSARPAAAAATLQELEYLDLDHELSKPFLVSSAQVRAVDHEVVFSFPAAGQPGRKPGVRTPRPKRSKKSQLKKVVFEVPVADGGVSSDLWAWRKYGQKPIKGSPYPRGYYKCSSLKGCMARKMVERSPAKPGVLIVTYMAEHCHPVPTQLNALSGTTRHKPSSTAPPDDHCSPKSPGKAAACEDRNGASAMAVDGCAEMADDENELWLGLDEFLGHMDGDFGHVFEECAVLGRRLSL